MKKTELKKAMENVNLSEEAKLRILKKVMNNKKERRVMTKKKIGLIAVAAAMIVGVVAYASSGMLTWNAHSGKPEYITFPAETEIVKDIGYAPKLVEIFENGFAFKEAAIVKNAMEIEGGSTQKFKSFSVEYSYADESINISAMESKYYETREGEKIAEIDGVELYYSQAIHKSVPPKYEKTAEDLEAEAAGELMIGYGSEKVEEREFKYLSWIDNGIYYSLSQFDGTLTADDMMAMAEEMIELN